MKNMWADYCEWYKEYAKKVSRDVYSDKSFGFGKLTEITVNGPESLDFLCFVSRKGKDYNIQELEVCAKMNKGVDYNKPFSEYLQSRRNDLIKIWSEE